MQRFIPLLALLAVWLSASPACAQNKGLSDDELQDWYHLSQGTEVFPYRFLQAIKDFDTGKPFIEDLNRFGFILDPKSEYGVPIGMSVSDTRDLRFAGVKMIGLNCSACHTAQMTFGGKTVRFDGGTNMLNVRAFSKGIKQSIGKTISNPVELLGFIARLAQQDLDILADAPLAKRLGASLMPAPVTTRTSGLMRRVAAKTEKPLEKVFASAALETIGRELARPPINLRKGLVTSSTAGKLADSAKRKLADDLAPPAAMLQRLRFPVVLPIQAEFADSIHNLVTTVRLLRARLEILTQTGEDDSPGHGRVDAFGAARNRLFPGDSITLNAPVRFPFIWEIPLLPWYHWDGNTTSALERNVGEALGVGVVVDVDTKESTLQLANLKKLESYAFNLKVPAWPAKIFGDIEDGQVAKGKVLFDKHCLRCHAIPAKGKIEDKIVPVEDDMDPQPLGTDRLRVDNIRTPVKDKNFFDAISPILKDVLRVAGEPIPGNENLWRPSTTNQPDLKVGYPNRALRAVWASPPYLHNGSVPSIYELLLPVAQRTKVFAVGHREYDPRKLGYELRLVADATSTLMDTGVLGNHNTGHVYGADLMNDDDRYALIEYMKTR